MSVDLFKYINAYIFEAKLPGSGKKVKFKPFTVGQLKKILTYDNLEESEVVEEMIDDLISTSIVDESFNIDELYLQDRFFLLFEIRKVSKGRTYDFTHTCQKCRSQSLQKVNLDKIKILPIKKKEDIVKLDDNVSVGIKLVTRGAQREAHKLAGSLQEYGFIKDAEATILLHALSITKIITPDGEMNNPSLEEKLVVVEKSPESWYERIKDWFKNNDFGVEFKTKIVCPHCSAKEEVNIPLDNFFFSSKL